MNVGRYDLDRITAFTLNSKQRLMTKSIRLGCRSVIASSSLAINLLIAAVFSYSSFLRVSMPGRIMSLWMKE